MSINNTLKSLGVGLLLMTFFSCKTIVKFTKKAPCNDLEASIQHWIGGAYGTGKGIYIVISTPTDINFKPDTVYYNGQKGELLLESKTPKLVYRANLTQVTSKESEISGNQSSTFDTDSIAKKGELVFSFLRNNKKWYYKFKKFEKKPILMFASAKPKE
jgi:hypothetical protein